MLLRPTRSTRTATLFPYPSLFRALPAFRGIGVEQFIGERPDDVVVQRLGARGKILVPPPARRIERITRRLRHEPFFPGVPAQPEIMAHADIMVDELAITEVQHVAQ